MQGFPHHPANLPNTHLSLPLSSPSRARLGVLCRCDSTARSLSSVPAQHSPWTRDGTARLLCVERVQRRVALRAFRQAETTVVTPPAPRQLERTLSLRPRFGSLRPPPSFHPPRPSSLSSPSDDSSRRTRMHNHRHTHRRTECCPPLLFRRRQMKNVTSPTRMTNPRAPATAAAVTYFVSYVSGKMTEKSAAWTQVRGTSGDGIDVSTTNATQLTSQSRGLGDTYPRWRRRSSSRAPSRSRCPSSGPR